MEYQGIITGIGDKLTNANIIKPEFDAIINKFIIGKNTIIEGLKLNGKNLSAGTCILCGYRGIIEESKALDTVAYVYGKFTLNFGNGEDSFNIVTSSTALTENVNPTEITSAGVYYLLLYVNGESKVDNQKYLLNSQYSVETQNVLDDAVVAPTVTTPTDINSSNQVITDLHLTQPNRVVNTEYVHAQIEREIGYERLTETIEDGDNLVELDLYYKAGYCIGKLYVILSGNTYTQNKVLYTLPKKFRPFQKLEIIGSGILGSPRWKLIVDTEGKIYGVQVADNTVGSIFNQNTFGYQCQ